MLTAGQGSPWKKLLERPHSREHFVQLYDAGESHLVENVGLYLSEGLKSGDGVVVIATPEHRALFCENLDQCGVDAQAATAGGQLVLLDAQETLARFVEAGQPDWNLFERTVGTVIGKLSPRSEYGGCRAYGEMVGILWKNRQFAAAARLEQFWNRLLARSSFSLYCAYAIDIFDKEFHPRNLDGVLCTHTHLVPAGSDGNLDTALRLSMEEVLGGKANEVRALTRAHHHASWATMPDAEATVLWLRKNLPEQAEDIIGGARHHYDRLSAKTADRGGSGLPLSPSQLQVAK